MLRQVDGSVLDSIERKRQLRREASMRHYDKHLRKPRQMKEYDATPEELDRAYIAGILDGEGSLTIRQRPTGSLDFWITVVNTCSPLLERIKSFYGGSIHARKQIEGRQQIYALTLSGREAIRLISEVVPYSIVKYDQCMAFLASYERFTVNGDGTGRRGIKLTEEQIAERREAVDLLKALKRPISSEG